MTTSARIRVSAILALGAGFALRLYLVLQFPMNAAADSATYVELARNWLERGVYGVPIDGVLTPVDIRAPGYPAFLAAIMAAFHGSHLAILLAQVVVDLATCCVVALLASRLAPAPFKRRAAMAALWLSALCPFIANYTTGVLTEVLAAFLTALALLVFREAMAGPEVSAGAAPHGAWYQDRWLLGGLVAGFATLVRPESPLLVAAAGVALLARWWRPANWRRLVRAGVLMFAGLILPLIPWAIRNARTVGEVQFLAPRYTQLPGEFVPRGFYSWTGTWLWRFRDVYLVPWKLEDEEIYMSDIPGYAFDSPEERDRIAAVLDEYNDSLTLSPEEDDAFAGIARERTARHPLRTYMTVPLKRAFSLWFTPRVELLPFSGDLWPIRAAWREDPVDFTVTVTFAAIAIFLMGAALAGAWFARRSPAMALLAVYCVVRTLFLVQYDTPEPRYVIECFPAILALAAQIFVPRR
jgi:hypothetical protein